LVALCWHRARGSDWRARTIRCTHSDTRLGMQAQTVAMDFQKVFRVTDKAFLGLAGLATDVQTVSQL